MGCPDWPRCFGQWVPPTTESQLPSDYKVKYAAQRDQKNQKFARYLSIVGFREIANQIREDKSILLEADFNAARTWTEYVNRVIGVLVGFMILATTWRAFPFRRTRPNVTWLAVLTLMVVVIQGWFGSIVVSTNLTSWTVTVHLVLALVVVGLLSHLWVTTGQAVVYPGDRGLSLLLMACMALLLTQVFLGTEVREAIDRLSAKLPRERWIEELGIDFLVHRSFSWTVLLVHVILVVKWRKTVPSNPLSLWLIVLILSTFLTGAGMAYLGVPAYLQPLHLLLATVTFGVQYVLLLRLNTKGISVVNTQKA